MGHSFTFDLPPDLAERAEAVARHTCRRVEDVLLDWLGQAASDVPVDTLPDDQRLALCDQRLSETDQRDLGELLARQREGTLDEFGRQRLEALMGVYRRGMVQKAQAIQVAVERNLRVLG